jgi:hypothetical protein
MRNSALLAVLALPACAAPTPAEVPVRGGGPYVCRGDDLGRFVGQPATQELGSEMQRVSGARTLQWVGHGMMVTMDFSPERLRVFLTADNRIERANCG